MEYDVTFKVNTVKDISSDTLEVILDAVVHAGLESDHVSIGTIHVVESIPKDVNYLQTVKAVRDRLNCSLVVAKQLVDGTTVNKPMTTNHVSQTDPFKITITRWGGKHNRSHFEIEG